MLVNLSVFIDWQILSFPLSDVSRQGEEILVRMQTRPGGMLTRGADYVTVLQDVCPAGESLSRSSEHNTSRIVHNSYLKNTVMLPYHTKSVA